MTPAMATPTNTTSATRSRAEVSRRKIDGYASAPYSAWAGVWKPTPSLCKTPRSGFGSTGSCGGEVGFSSCRAMLVIEIEKLVLGESDQHRVQRSVAG